MQQAHFFSLYTYIQIEIYVNFIRTFFILSYIFLYVLLVFPIYIFVFILFIERTYAYIKCYINNIYCMRVFFSNFIYISIYTIYIHNINSLVLLFD